MFAWLNLAVLVYSSLFFLYFYVLSVSPAALEKLGTPDAYQRCAHYRVIAFLLELIIVVNYVAYTLVPLQVPLPRAFPWPLWVSLLIVFVILIPSGWIMVRGILDAGVEAVRPRKEHTLFKGVYQKIRHPQALGEVFLFWVFAFWLNSPFLAFFSFIYIPIFLIMCLAEEKDLLLRYGESYAEYARQTGAFIPKSDEGN